MKKSVKYSEESSSNKVDSFYSSRPPRKLFADLYKKSIELGLKPKDFQHLDGIQEIKKSCEKNSYFGNVIKLICIFITAILITFVAEWPVTNTHFLVWWFKWYNTDPFQEPCVAYLPETIVEAVKPPIDCGFCKNVLQIDRVQNISIEQFENKFVNILKFEDFQFQLAN